MTISRAENTSLFQELSVLHKLATARGLGKAAGLLIEFMHRINFGTDILTTEAPRPHRVLQHDGYFLLSFDKDWVLVSVDGSHDNPEGVATAKRIIEGCGLGDGDTYRMAYISEVGQPGPVNEEAIQTIRMMKNGY